MSATLLLSQGGYVYDGHPVYDYQFYRTIGELSLSGFYPSLDYWLEYPPVFSWTIVAIYRLSLLLPAVRDPIFWFHNFLGTFLSLVDSANLALIYAIELRLTERARALRAAWMYALLFWPLFVMLGWLDPLPLFFLLATVYGLATDRPLVAGLAAGFGFMTKLIPVVVAPAALRAFGSRSKTVICLGAAAGIVVLLSLPFLLSRPAMFLAGFQSAFARSSWETIWALLEGYFDVGVVAPLDVHVDPSTAAWQNHAQTLPWMLITGVFACIYALALWKARLRQAKAKVAFAGLAITLFLMFSKGYSSQFIVYLLPFVVLLMPDGRGVSFALLLSALNVLQFPLYPMLFRSQTWLLWTIVILRTLLWSAFALVCLSYATSLPAGWMTAVRRRLVPVTLIVVTLAIFGLAWPLLDSFVRGRGAYYDLQQYLRPLAAAGQGVILSDRDLIGYTYPFLDGSAVYVLPSDWERRRNSEVESLKSFAASRSQVWLVLDYSRGEDARQGFLERTLDTYGAKSTNRWFETFRLVGYVPFQPSAKLARTLLAKFGQSLVLDGYDVPASVVDGDPVRVRMVWHTLSRVSSDYSVFVHMVSGKGAIVAQRDKPLTDLGKPTSGWPKDTRTVDADDILVPLGTPTGTYTLLAGLYHPDTGERLKLDGGADSQSLGTIQVIAKN